MQCLLTNMHAELIVFLRASCRDSLWLCSSCLLSQERCTVVHQRYQEGSHMCHIGFTAAEFVENIFYMLNVELAEPILYLGRRPFFFVYPDSFFAACEHFCRDVYKLIYCGFLKGRSDMRAS